MTILCPNQQLDHDSVKPYQALQEEYRDCASWYDSFWADYTHRTLQVPLQLVYKSMLQQHWKRNGADHDDKEKQKTTIETHQAVVVVDIGCGTGEFLRRLQDETAAGDDDDDNDMKQREVNGRGEASYYYYGIEPSVEMLQKAKTKSSTIQWMPSAAESLPLKDAFADIVCSTNAFHFFRSKPIALQEMYRILKPKEDNNSNLSPSSLIITDWCADFWQVRLYHLVERLWWNVWKGFTDRYPGPLTSRNLLQVVEQAGFTNVKVETYSVRVFTFFFWGMQTVTATKQ